MSSQLTQPLWSQISAIRTAQRGKEDVATDIVNRRQHRQEKLMAEGGTWGYVGEEPELPASLSQASSQRTQTESQEFKYAQTQQSPFDEQLQRAIQQSLQTTLAQSPSVLSQPRPEVESELSGVDRVSRQWRRKGDLGFYVANGEYLDRFDSIGRVLITDEPDFLQLVPNTTDIGYHIQELVFTKMSGWQLGSLMALMALAIRHSDDPVAFGAKLDRTFTTEFPIQINDLKGLVRLIPSAELKASMAADILLEDGKDDVPAIEAFQQYVSGEQEFVSQNKASMADDEVKLTEFARFNGNKITVSPWFHVVDALRETVEDRFVRPFPFMDAVRAHLVRQHFSSLELNTFRKAGLSPAIVSDQLRANEVTEMARAMHLREMKSGTRPDEPDLSLEDLVHWMFETMDICTAWSSMPWRLRFEQRDYDGKRGSEEPELPLGAMALLYLISIINGEDTFHIESALKAAICVIMFGYTELDPMHLTSESLSSKVLDSYARQHGLNKSKATLSVWRFMSWMAKWRPRGVRTPDELKVAAGDDANNETFETRLLRSRLAVLMMATQHRQHRYILKLPLPSRLWVRWPFGDYSRRISAHIATAALSSLSFGSPLGQRKRPADTPPQPSVVVGVESASAKRRKEAESRIDEILAEAREDLRKQEERIRESEALLLAGQKLQEDFEAEEKLGRGARVLAVPVEEEPETESQKESEDYLDSFVEEMMRGTGPPAQPQPPSSQRSESPELPQSQFAQLDRDL